MFVKTLAKLLILFTLCQVNSTYAEVIKIGKKDLLSLSLKELLEIKVVSVSNVAEKLSEAPATVIVLTREELQLRGYSELSNILDDLPGMQVVRPFGDTYVKNYWRGYRGFKGDTYQLLVDGLQQQHLWYNEVEAPWVALPISNIERIEIVYGPASAVYGANAMMGVINVITEKDRENDGSFSETLLINGSLNTRIFDSHYFYKKDSTRLSLAARYDDHALDNSTSNNYYYTQDSLYQDQQIWGDFAELSGYSGSHNSQTRGRSVNARLYLDNTEIGLEYYLLRSGTGNEYAADAAQRGHFWGRRELSYHIRHNQAINDKLNSVSLLRWRDSSNPRDSYFIERYGTTVDFSYYQTQSFSATLQQDFDYQHNDNWSFNFGFRYERKDLQKGYNNPYGDFVTAPETVDLNEFQFPELPSSALDYDNRILTDDLSAYLQSKWKINEQNIVVLGGRFDDNSVFGSTPSLRLGYIGNYGAWVLKALYGEGYQEPSQRVLYGYWAAGQANAELAPETSNTTEVSLNYTSKNFSTTLSNWQVNNKNITVPSQPFALNLGESQITGSDLQFKYQAKNEFAKFKGWVYLSYLYDFTGKNNPDLNGNIPFDGLTADGEVADLSPLQMWAGITVQANNIPLNLTLRGRHIGSRNTVASNPVESVNAYQTFDLSIAYNDLANIEGWEIGLNILNLTDKQYFHPGVSSATAGITPGSFDADNVWHGSDGFYSSLLAQPGRTIQLFTRLSF